MQLGVLAPLHAVSACGASSSCYIAWLLAGPAPCLALLQNALPCHNTAVCTGCDTVAGVYGCRLVQTSETQWPAMQQKGKGTCLLGWAATPPAELQQKGRIHSWDIGDVCPPSHSHCHKPKLQAPRAAAAHCMRTSTGCTFTPPTDWGPCNEGVHGSAVADGYQIELKVLTCEGHVSACW